MILNIVDRRKQIYRWKCIDAIIEPTWHDNACADSDYADHEYGEPMYEARKESRSQMQLYGLRVLVFR
jgi:hypothetical protein